MGYIGDSSGIARKITKLYMGNSSGLAKTVTKAYIGDSSGIARLWWSIDSSSGGDSGSGGGGSVTPLVVPRLAIPHSSGVDYPEYYWFGNSFHRNQITYIHIYDDESGLYQHATDISLLDYVGRIDDGISGVIKLYLTEDLLEDGYYRALIVGNGTGSIKANYNSGSMFYWFRNLKGIYGLNLLDTSDVTDMSGMFQWCSSLETLDLTTFDTGSVTTMAGMFNNSANLTTITVSQDLWVTAADTDLMFSGCGTDHLTYV